MEQCRNRLLGSYVLFLLSVYFLGLVAPAPTPAPQVPGCNLGDSTPPMPLTPVILNVNVERVLINNPDDDSHDYPEIRQKRECCRGAEDEEKDKIRNLEPGEDLLRLGTVAVAGVEILRDEKMVEGKIEDVAECCRGVAEKENHP